MNKGKFFKEKVPKHISLITIPRESGMSVQTLFNLILSRQIISGREWFPCKIIRKKNIKF